MRPNKIATLFHYLNIFIFIHCLSLNLLWSGYRPNVESLANDPTYVCSPTHRFWKMLCYYTRQKTDASCSLASVALVLNAVLFQNTGQRESISHEQILSATNDLLWLKSTAMNGRGLDFEEMPRLISKTFHAFNLHIPTCKLVRIEKLDNTAKQEFDSVLQLVETNPSIHLIFLFDQSYALDTEPVGHYSVFAAYDSAKQRVLLFDVDQDIPAPYWIHIDTLMQSMHACETTLSGQSLHMGYLLIYTKPL